MLSIAIHSHKGGVGKSTLAINLAVLLAKRGSRVCLLDYDLGGPNLYTFFQDLEPKKYLDQLFIDKAKPEEVISDVSEFAAVKNGKLYVGLTNPSSQHASFMANMGSDEAMKMLQSSFSLRRILKADPYNIDYLILDTTPGLAFTTVNSFMLTDLIIFIIKFSNSDIEGTVNMITGLLESLPNKACLIANSIPYAKVKNEDLIKEIEEKIISDILAQTDLDSINILGWVPHDEDLINVEFDNMVNNLRDQNSKRVVHALSYDEHPILDAMNSIVDNLVEKYKD